MGESLNKNFPKTAKCFVYMKEVWCETFPDEVSNSKRKIKDRKAAAKQTKGIGIITGRYGQD